jgi:folate-dependent phosphoribosylglycinamide formyltransferase PurN
MKTLLICHQEALLDREGLARWMASFSDLEGVVLLREKLGRRFKRAKREIKRVGVGRFLDVTAFHLYYRLFQARKDFVWEKNQNADLCRAYPPLSETPVLITHSPNSDEAEKFIKRQTPDIIIARCKVILNKRIFSLARTGTFVMHPGVCPEYRNSHGCFWALVHGDFDKVGMTLLRIDEGVDTGPIYGYYTYDYDSLKESHICIQHRVVIENLRQLQTKLGEINDGLAKPIDVTGRESNTWGQPWLTKYIAWKQRAKREGR